MIGKAQGVVVKSFDDYTDGSAITKLNKFIQENPDITLIKVQYFNGYSVVDNDKMDGYGRETALLIYREPDSTYGSVLDEIEEKGLLPVGDIKLEKLIEDIYKTNKKLIDKYKR